VSLRYFNVAGATSALLADRGASNLVPMVLGRIREGRPPQVFGTDYATPDGSCVRDFVHVEDLARAHLRALDAIVAGGPGHRIFNVGTGRGSSVLEMVREMLRVTGSTLSPAIEPRRPGDAAIVVADVSRIGDELGWTARRGIEEMIESAWRTSAA
jgi:UDP-glucose 4-epimerase